MTIARRLRISLSYFCLVGLLTPITFAQDRQSSLTRQAPLPVEAAASALKFERSPIDISPDGRWVAYVLKNPRLKEPQTETSDQVRFSRTGVPYLYWGCDVWITNTQSGESKNLTEYKGTSWAPRWSPDSSLLAFYSDRNGIAQLWTWEKRSGKLGRVSAAVVRPWYLETVAWTPDSKSIITKVLPPGESLDGLENTNAPVIDRQQTDTQQRQRQASPRVLVYTSRPIGNKIDPADPKVSNLELPPWSNSLRGELALIDVSSGKLQFLAKGVRPNLFSFSPDGTRVVLSVPKQRKTPNSLTFLYDLVVVSLANLHSQVISEFSPGVPSLRVAWSSDGTLLSYVSDGECFVYPIGREVRKASKTSHPRFTGKPMWDANGQYIYLLGGNTLWKITVANGSIVPALRDSERQIVGLIAPGKDRQQDLYVGTRNDKSKQQGFYRVKLSTGEVSKLIENNKIYDLSLSDVSADGQQIVFGAQDAQHDQNLWIVDSAFRSPRQLTNVNPQFDQVAMGTSRLIEYKSNDRQELRGALLLPADYQEGKRYPLIVKVYGGDMLSNYVNQFGFSAFGNDNMQLFATRGYAVLLPDTPLRIGTPMRDLAKTVLPAIDKVIDMGVADPERLGIMGHSYGGYSTLSLIVQSTRFKAAHMDAGQGNLVGTYGGMMKSGDTFGVGWAEEGQGRMGGTPWEFRERYIENSPVFYLDRVQTPLFISQGALDTDTFLSDEIFVGLRRLGKEVLYAKYEGEGHGIEGYANKIDYWNRMIGWFDLHLKNISK